MEEDKSIKWKGKKEWMFDLLTKYPFFNGKIDLCWKRGLQIEKMLIFDDKMKSKNKTKVYLSLMDETEWESRHLIFLIGAEFSPKNSWKWKRKKDKNPKITITWSVLSSQQTLLKLFADQKYTFYFAMPLILLYFMF